MKEKLQQSAKSTNFWNNVSTILGAIALGILTAVLENPESIKDAALMFLLTSGIHNAGNILAHMNKDN